MLTAYVPRGGTLEAMTLANGVDVPKEAVWIDLFNPAPDDDDVVERLVGIAVPTREEMQEIELSSRLYIEDGARYMTATLMCNSDTPLPKTTPVTFILADHRLITVRYDEPKPFAIIRHKLGRSCPQSVSGETVMLELLDAVIDRAADILEKVGLEVDAISQRIFDPERARDSKLYKSILQTIGRKGDQTSKARESLVSIGRVLLFLANETDSLRWAKESRSQIKAMQRDVQSLSDHTSYLTNNITFQLDALLGVVTIEQNDIIKLFSVAAVILMPPTLVASIYGMNFKHMPELDWTLGYPMAILIMLVAGLLPYMFFKWKKWL